MFGRVAYTQLKPLAKALEHAPPRPGYRNEWPGKAVEWESNDALLIFYRDGHRVCVSLQTSSGTVCGVSFEVSTTKLPHIALRAEWDGDRSGKASGVDREVQTGDAEFDASIFIDSEAPDDEILAVLGAQRVRDALRAIVGKTHSHLTFSDEKLSAHGANDNHVALLVPERALQVVDELIGVVRAIPAVHPTGAKPRSLGAVLLFAWCSFAFVMSIATTSAANASYPPVDNHPHLVMVAFGLLGALCMQPLIRAVHKGRSSSSTSRLIMTIFSIVSMLLLPHGVVLTLNGYLDRGRGVDREVEVLSSRYLSDEHQSQIEVQSWRAEGGRLSFTGAGEWTTARRAKLRTRPGLIWEWREGPVR